MPLHPSVLPVLASSRLIRATMPDRHTYGLDRGEDQEARWRARAVQGADEQAAERAWKGTSTTNGSIDSRSMQPICIVKNAIQERALRTLKQKRMYESQLAQLTQQTFNMESAALATENLRNTMVTVDAMKQANKELKKQYGKFDIDKIEVRLPGLLGCGRTD